MAVSNKDIYADKDGKLTDDPEKFALQVATAGVELDDRIVKRYGIEDSLVSVDEPRAIRKVRMAGESESKPAKEPESEPKPLSIQSEADAKAAEPKAEETKTEPAKKAEAKKGAKKK